MSLAVLVMDDAGRGSYLATTGCVASKVLAPQQYKIQDGSPIISPVDLLQGEPSPGTTLNFERQMRPRGL
jgi:hypothetical protein